MYTCTYIYTAYSLQTGEREGQRGNARVSRSFSLPPPLPPLPLPPPPPPNSLHQRQRPRESTFFYEFKLVVWLRICNYVKNKRVVDDSHRYRPRVVFAVKVILRGKGGGNLAHTRLIHISLSTITSASVR
jgi:hypothetical protein